MKIKFSHSQLLPFSSYCSIHEKRPTRGEKFFHLEKSMCLSFSHKIYILNCPSNYYTNMETFRWLIWDLIWHIANVWNWFGAQLLGINNRHWDFSCQFLVDIPLKFCKISNIIEYRNGTWNLIKCYIYIYRTVWMVGWTNREKYFHYHHFIGWMLISISTSLCRFVYSHVYEFSW